MAQRGAAKIERRLPARERADNTSAPPDIAQNGFECSSGLLVRMRRQCSAGKV